MTEVSHGEAGKGRDGSGTGGFRTPGQERTRTAHALSVCLHSQASPKGRGTATAVRNEIPEIPRIPAISRGWPHPPCRGRREQGLRHSPAASEPRPRPVDSSAARTRARTQINTAFITASQQPRINTEFTMDHSSRSTFLEQATHLRIHDVILISEFLSLQPRTAFS